MSDDEWEYEEYEDDEDEEWEEDVDGPLADGDLSRTLPFGFVSMLPLFAAYEIVQGASTRPPRAMAEAILSTPLGPLGEDAVRHARWGLLAILGLAAFVVCARREWELGPRLFRVAAEGTLGALLLGPVLVLAAGIAEPHVGRMVLAGVSETVPMLSRVSVVMGGAAYEEIVFRVGVLSLAWVVARQFARWLGAGERLSRWFAAGSGALVSALAFSAFHLGALTPWLGGGEGFDLAVFTWRAMAGVLLACIFLWRGVGVAAWTHALFNASILIGAGPSAFTP